MEPNSTATSPTQSRGTCFDVMNFGKKADFETGRTLLKLRASETTDRSEAIADFVQAQRARREVPVEVCAGVK